MARAVGGDRLIPGSGIGGDLHPNLKGAFPAPGWPLANANRNPSTLRWGGSTPVGRALAARRLADGALTGLSGWFGGRKCGGGNRGTPARSVRQQGNE